MILMLGSTYRQSVLKNESRTFGVSFTQTVDLTVAPPHIDTALPPLTK